MTDITVIRESASPRMKKHVIANRDRDGVRASKYNWKSDPHLPSRQELDSRELFYISSQALFSCGKESQPFFLVQDVKVVGSVQAFVNRMKIWVYTREKPNFKKMRIKCYPAYQFLSNYPLASFSNYGQNNGDRRSLLMTSIE